MKKVIHKIIYQAVKIDLVWFILSPLLKLSSWLTFHRNVVIGDRRGPNRDLVLEEICKDPIVKNGPFKGLRYPDFTSFGSAIFPKIVGCYEREIESAIEDICKKDYTEVIDVGCAEGYYAVGFAMRIKNASVYAYDIDKDAGEYCKVLAELNKVSDRITVRGEMSPLDLAAFPFTGRGLILCDCEGFEKELFTKDNIRNLANCDLIIEMHDFVDIHISDYITNLFIDSHHITKFRTLDDIVKARTYDYPEWMDLDLTIRKKLFAEGRPTSMEWAYLESKSTPA